MKDREQSPGTDENRSWDSLVDELFERVSQVPQEERQDWLDRNCQDPRARAQVDRLLRFDDTAFFADRPGEQDPLEVGGALFGPLWDEVEAELERGEGPAPGDALGPYRIIGVLGAGGMGRVYRARHPDLGREVAIKALPETLHGDPELLKRFQQEARVLAQLNHPNIATLHELLVEGDRPYLVLELVEGETLARLLDRKKLDVREAMRLAEQIAAGLEEAHSKGVIHRDLKPSNVMVTPEGRLKILDFGLAKAEVQAGSLSASQETLIPVTRTGTVMGTTAYMSPEQASGDAVDRRTDIWSFGCVLFELITGERAFGRDSQPETLGAVLRDEPEWHKIPKKTPAPAVALLTRCLRKDPNRRLRDIGDARLVLLDIAEDDSSASLWPGPETVLGRRSHGRNALLLAPWLLTFGLGLWVLFSPRVERTAASESTATRLLEVGLPTDAELSPYYYPAFSLSPDGQQIVYVVREPGLERLYHRSFDRLEARPLPGTEGGALPVFSQDGRAIAFLEDRDLLRFELDSDRVVTVAEIGAGSRGYDWTPSGGFVFAPNQTSGLYTIDERGEGLTPLTELDPQHDEKSHRWPQWIRGTDFVIYTVQYEGASFDDAALELVDTRSSARTQILERGAHGRVTPDGILVFVHRGRLYRSRIDFERLEVVGEPQALLGGVAYDPRNGGTQLSLSEQGTLAYVPGTPVSEARDIVRFSTQGDRQPITSEPREFREPRLSPDGTKLVFGLGGAFDADLCTLDLTTGTLSQLTYDQAIFRPIWSRDGSEIAFAVRNDGSWSLLTLEQDGRSASTTIHQSERRLYPNSWLPDGRLLFEQLDAATGWDLLVLDPETHQVETVLATPANEARASVSADGSWIAFESDELQGFFEVYVQRFAGGARVRVSEGGARWPRFADDQLYYWSTDGPEAFRVRKVTYDLSSGRFEVLDQTVMEFSEAPGRAIVVTPAWAGLEVDERSGDLVLLEQDEPATDRRRLVIATQWQ